MMADIGQIITGGQYKIHICIDSKRRLIFQSIYEPGITVGQTSDCFQGGFKLCAFLLRLLLFENLEVAPKNYMIKNENYLFNY